VERLARLERDLANVKEDRGRLRSHWEQEKSAIQDARTKKEELERLRHDIDVAQRAGDYATASELQYGRVPDLERQIRADGERLADLQRDTHMLTEEVDEEDIAEVVAKWTGIPVSRLMEGEVQKLIRMEERLHERVVGQDEAVTSVANAIRPGSRRSAGSEPPARQLSLPRAHRRGQDGAGPRAGGVPLRRRAGHGPHRHVGEVPGEAHRLAMVGAPPGYVGFEDAGQLTEAVRRRPYAVVLFDEIEKAHADVLNVLLQLLDDGRLTDGQGRTIDFKNTVVIMTSNLGSQYIAGRASRPGADLDDEARAQVMEALRAHFKPEFLNRVDEIIFFHALGRPHLLRIVDIQLRGLLRRLESRKITLELTDKARNVLVDEGYDPAYGARPLKRTIQRKAARSARAADPRGRICRWRYHPCRGRRRRSGLRKGGTLSGQER